MPRDNSIKKVLVIGSGPIIIGQAAEFDYAGAQACRILKEEGINVVLVNSNPATIMTDKNLADEVVGCGVQKGKPEYYRGVMRDIQLLPRVQVEIVVAKVPVQQVIDVAKKVLYTGHIGDGKIFIYDVENVIKVRTGEEGFAALQDEE